jgi:hypothetical protein
VQHRLATIAASSEAPMKVLCFIRLPPTGGVFDRDDVGIEWLTLIAFFVSTDSATRNG